MLIFSLFKQESYTTMINYSVLFVLSIYFSQNVAYASDVGKNSLELITSYNYPLEIHDVTTNDSYILQMHRIPHGRNSTNSTKGPVLLMHGFGGDSSNWVNHGSRSLGFMLADEGYDVWLGNSRGNMWSRRHVYLDTSSTSFKYWDFSFHETGVYDLPAKIDHILSETGWPNLFYVGHSRGTTSFFAMNAILSQYNSKIKLMSALAPVAYMSHTTNPNIILLSATQNELTFSRYLGYNRLDNDPYARSIFDLCTIGVTSPTCDILVFVFLGYDYSQMEEYMTPVVCTNDPAGNSVKDLVHYIQLHDSGTFRRYDYGSISENIAKYGSFSPPDYQLSNVKAPVALYYGSGDSIASVEDVDHLANELGNVVLKYLVPYDVFNHLDFLWAKDVVPLLYEKLIGFMNTYIHS